VTKPELRETIRERLRAPDRTALAAASARLCAALLSMPEWSAARRVAAFLPLPREPQIQPLWQVESARIFCFPQVRGEEVVLLRVEDPTLLAGADWHLDTAALARCPRVAPADLDAILVPGVAFTRAGLRLGRGGGYYDRLLAQCGSGTLRIGVAFSCQLVDELPCEPHDQRVDLVLTEETPLE